MSETNKQITQMFKWLSNDQINAFYVEIDSAIRFKDLYNTTVKELNFNFESVNIEYSIGHNVIDGSGKNIVDSKSRKIQSDRIIDKMNIFMNTIILHEKLNSTVIFFPDISSTITDFKEKYKILEQYIGSGCLRERNQKLVLIGRDFNELPSSLKSHFKHIRVSSPSEFEILDLISQHIKIKKISLSDNIKNDIVKHTKGIDYQTIKEVLEDCYNDKQNYSPEKFKRARHKFIDNNNNLSVIDWERDYTELKGMQKLKDFTKKMIDSGNGRGILIVGVPGSGKTQFAKYLGKETNNLVVNLDMSKLKGKYVGDTETMTNTALETIDSVGRCIVLIDEIEKGLSAMSGVGSSDGGSSKNQGASVLKWLSDRSVGESYVIATANNIDDLPAEFKRAERWDGIFFLDLPTEEVRGEILKYYIDYYKLKVDEKTLVRLLNKTENWTGAEIKTLIRLTVSLNLSILEVADEYVTTIYSIDEQKIKNLREWSVGRTISTEHKIIIKPKPIKRSKQNEKL